MNVEGQPTIISGRAPKVTVVVPVYNTEQYLPRCLDSLCNQSYRDFDVIVVDDASNGPCDEIVKSFGGGSSRVHYIRHDTNKGLLHARLAGVRSTSSEYIAFLDSDDTAYPDFLNTLVTVADATEADIVSSNIMRGTSNEIVLEGSNAILSGLCDRKIANVAVWTKLFRRALFEKAPELMEFGLREHIVRSEDRVITTTLCMKSQRFVQISEILVEYNRNRPDSSTNVGDFDHIKKEVLDIQNIVEYFKFLLPTNVFLTILMQMMAIYNVKVRHLDKKSRTKIFEQFHRGPATEEIIPVLLQAVDSYLQSETERNGRQRNKIDRLQMRVDALQSALRRREDRIQKLQSALRKLQSASRMKEDRIQKLQSALRKLQSALRKLQSALRRKEDRIQELIAALKTARIAAEKEKNLGDCLRIGWRRRHRWIPKRLIALRNRARGHKINSNSGDASD